MSVINQMLRALDARRATAPSEAGEGVVAWIDPAADEARARRRRLMGMAAIGAVVIAAAAWVDWPFGTATPVRAPRPMAMSPEPTPATAEGAASALPAVAAVSASAAASRAPVAASAPGTTPVAQTASPVPVAASAATPVVAALDAEPRPRLRAARERLHADSTRSTPSPLDDDASPLTLRAESVLWTRSTRSLNELRPPPEAPAVTGSAEKRPIAATAAQRVTFAYAQASEWAASGHSGQALDKALDVLSLDPDHQAARQLAAVLLCEARRFAEAAALLRTGLQRQPQQPQFAYLLARLQVESGDAAAALAVLSSQQSLGVDGHALKGGVLMRQGRAREAGEAYQAVVRLAPDSATGWLGLGLALEAEGRMADAKLALQRARGAGGLQGDLLAYVDQKLAGMR
jgi:MSHA biogenesis protein MshN